MIAAYGLLFEWWEAAAVGLSAAGVLGASIVGLVTRKWGAR